MAICRDRRVHPVYWAFLAVAVLSTGVVPAATHAHAVRDQRAAERMQTIAERVQSPAALTPLVLRHDCNGDGLIVCGWTSDQDVDGLSRATQAALSAAAERPAQLRCTADYYPSLDSTLRSCLVQILDGSHAVTIFVDPYARFADHSASLIGSRYTVQAD